MKMERFQKVVSVLDGLLKFLYRLNIAVIVISAILFFFLWYLYLGAPQIFEQFHPDLSFGNINFEIADTISASESYGFHLLLFGSVLTVISLPIFLMTFDTLREILAPMKQGLIFHEDIPHDLRKLALLVLANGILNQAVKLIFSGNILAGYDLNTLFLSDKITSVSVGYNFNFGFILHALVIFALSFIFTYGKELQDKTAGPKQENTEK